jgi:hypothetical protein
MPRAPHRWTTLGLLFTTLALTAPRAVEAQSYAVTTWNQLNALFERVSEEGYSSSKYIIGRLNQGEEETWNIRLFAGNDYYITGVCDGDCKDVDLTLADAAGRELTSDTSDDDVPVMRYRVKTTGTYSIKVNMFTCGADPCYFGLGIFFK